jgi:uncharacterized protein (TIGR01777 family)
MNTVLLLFGVQAVLGALDNLWHHELSEGLPGKRAARVETALHSARELLYAAFFFGIAWRQWHGAWAWAVAALLVLEIIVTLTDFVVEDSTRRLPKSERVLHTILAVNLGAALALFAPQLWAWLLQPTALVAIHYGIASFAFTAFGVGVLAWGLRDALAAARWFRRPNWQTSGLEAGHKDAPRRVLVTGATGFIGRHLVRKLIACGDEVLVLARNRDKAFELFGRYAHIVTKLEHIPSHRHIDAIVNLAGAPIAAWPWSKRRRRHLLDSRLAVTRALLSMAERLDRTPQTWINASAIGYYGQHRGDLRLHEKTPAGTGFQADLCAAWETLAARAAEQGAKVSVLRIGLVLGADGGALPALARPVRLGVGRMLGNGRQWMSWIHIDDLVALIQFVLEQETLAGPCNATAPQAVRHERFMRALANTLDRHLWPLAVPARLLRSVLGELAELFVDGQRVIPERAIALGFEFKYPGIDNALSAALGASAQLALAATTSPSSPGTAT